ncbi:MAG: hypothetical protein A3J97_05500 [Spirochaetes bacterium RIFOXYC1_FULL_54_7]|nr:MAG: hypothetical protein A3J97_05500 [Spirochaetes bacterium RIFOXYC1_FULL_54_7]
MVDNNQAASQGWTIPVLVSLAIMLPQIGSLFQATAPETGNNGAEWLANGMIQSISQIVLLAVIIGVSGKSREFGVQRPRPRDAPQAVLVFGSLFLIGHMVALALSILDPGSIVPSSGPSALSPGGSLSPAAFLALSAGFSLASAYREELFYRAYLLGSCRQRSTPPAAAVTVSVVMFAWGHAYQGPAGMAAAALVGLFLSIAWTRGTSVHALAWGHAAYNLGILVTLNTG